MRFEKNFYSINNNNRNLSWHWEKGLLLLSLKNIDRISSMNVILLDVHAYSIDRSYDFKWWYISNYISCCLLIHNVIKTKNCIGSFYLSKKTFSSWITVAAFIQLFKLQLELSYNGHICHTTNAIINPFDS